VNQQAVGNPSNPVPEMTMYRSVASYNLPFQLNLKGFLLLHIDKIPRNLSRIRIPQNPVLLLVTLLA